jgi:hypothetical protein
VTDTLASLERYCAARSLACARRGGAVIVAIPTQERGPGGSLGVALAPRGDVVQFSSFVIRGPDSDHERVYRMLLRKNLDCHGFALALDAHGDVWARGELDRATLSDDQLDRLLGSFVDVVETAWHALLRAGFVS